MKTPPEIGRVNKSLDGRVQKYDTKRTKILNVLTDLFTRPISEHAISKFIIEYKNILFV